MPVTSSVDPDTANERRQARRTARYEAQRLLWKVTKLRRLAYCGRVVQDVEAGVTIRLTGEPGTADARAGFSGLQTCGSVWSCPVCSEKINAVRQAELEAGITNWLEDDGHAVLFGTFTMRHNRRQSLGDLWDAVSPSWTKVASGPGWHGGKHEVGDKEAFGIAGWARVLEVKHGEDNGWHPHVHVLLFLEDELDDQQLEYLRARLHGRWERAINKAGYTTLEFDKSGHAVGTDLRRVKDAEFIADYFAKNGYHPKNTTAAAGAAYEVTGSHSKKQGKGGRTPFEILADLVARGAEKVDTGTGEIITVHSPADLALWHEWERTSRGRRQLTWSRNGLRERLGLDNVVDDQEIVEDDALAGDPVSLIGTSEWKAGGWALRRDQLLEWAESGAVQRELTRWRQERFGREEGASP